MKNQMDIETIIYRRLALRSFNSEEIPSDIIMKILKAGQQSASSKNSQPWHVIIIKDKKKLLKLSECTNSGSFIKDATIALAVISENAKLESDLGRFVQNMILTAWKYGVGTTWITNFTEETRDVLGVPKGDEFKVITVLPFGYPKTPPSSNPIHKRKDLSEFVHLESFGNYMEKI